MRSFGDLPSEEDNVIGDVRVSGDLGYVRGTVEVTSSPQNGGDPVAENVKWVAVYQRQPGGSWKIISDIWNSDRRPSQ